VVEIVKQNQRTAEILGVLLIVCRGGPNAQEEEYTYSAPALYQSYFLSIFRNMICLFVLRISILFFTISLPRQIRSWHARKYYYIDTHTFCQTRVAIILLHYVLVYIIIHVKHIWIIIIYYHVLSWENEFR